MAVTINGDGTISGISAGGLPDGVVDSGTLATGIDATKLADGTITNSELQYINSLSSNAQTQISAAGNPVHYFDAYLGTNLSVSDGVHTKITGTTEEEDSDGWYASDRWTPQVAGKYYIFGQVTPSTTLAGSNWHNGIALIYKNATIASQSQKNNWGGLAGQEMTLSTGIIVALNGSTDYVELWGHMNTTSATTPVILGSSLRVTKFCGFYIGA
jgi:hypothetical protein